MEYAVIGPLDGLVQHEGRIAGDMISDAALRQSDSVLNQRHPLFKVALGFGRDFIRR